MRITQGIIHRDFLKNLDRITNQINGKFQEISSGKRILRPSDDPVSLSRIMKLKDELSISNQYKENIKMAIGWLNITESAFNAMEDILKRLEEIAISMGSDNVSQAARKAAAEEIAHIKEHAIMIANTKFKGRYIFSGYLTDTSPFINADNEYHGDNNKIEIEVGYGIRFAYNISGSVFTEEVNIFQLMDDMKKALNSNDSKKLRTYIDKIHQAFNHLNTLHTKLGGKIKVLENIKEDISNRQLQVKDIISKKEDTDMAEAIPKLYVYQSGYQALLHSFAKITSISLFDIIG